LALILEPVEGWRAVDFDDLVLDAVVQGRDDRRAAQELAAQKLAVE